MSAEPCIAQDVVIHWKRQAQPPSASTSYDWLISLVVAPAAYAGAGVASEAIGRGTTLAVAAACIALPSLLILLSPGVRMAGAAPAT